MKLINSRFVEKIRELEPMNPRLTEKMKKIQKMDRELKEEMDHASKECNDQLVSLGILFERRFHKLDTEAKSMWLESASALDARNKKRVHAAFQRLAATAQVTLREQSQKSSVTEKGAPAIQTSVPAARMTPQRQSQEAAIAEKAGSAVRIPPPIAQVTPQEQMPKSAAAEKAGPAISRPAPAMQMTPQEQSQNIPVGISRQGALTTNPSG
jgi:hypothetical protein